MGQHQKPQAAIPVGVVYSPDLQAYRFEDDSNAPLAYKDWLFYIGEKFLGLTGSADSFPKDVPFMVQTKSGLIMIRKIRKGYTPGHYNLLHPVNNSMIEDVAIEWCAKMEAITPPKS